MRFLSHAEGGRASLPLQGYRPDIHYDDDATDELWMVWPLFTDSFGRELPNGTPIPQDAKANFYIIDGELRKTVHCERLRVGTRFHLREGGKSVAACEVTKLLELHANAA